MSLSLSPTLTTGMRPEQGKFTKIQKAFLNQHLPVYFSLDNKKKGAKKEWVLSNVYPLYVQEFNSDGPSGVNLASLETVCQFVNFMCRANDLATLTIILFKENHTSFFQCQTAGCCQTNQTC
jgi:hypothetical protein